ncbi:hypothetical protein QTO34_014215 [Cnephaeus nilssonii]|uniref:Uncharacterized protein n=1 Tax=Cnephaeus nilssonii TaxID=3371016 RepID=A0AA40I716_CNENI|nr:hypothetical protein QTO34_014215 [Eptesicus nilssonii]
MSEDQRASDLKRRRQLRQNVSEEQLLAKRHSEAERSRRHRQKLSKDQRASELERRRQCRQNMCKEQSLTSTANTDGVSRKFAQLYILDTAEATSKRLVMPENQDCSERLMININNLMHEINELTKSYKMLHEVEKEAQSEAAAKDSESKLRTEDDIDRIVKAEIPDEDQYPRLFQIVKSNMRHDYTPVVEGYNVQLSSCTEHSHPAEGQREKEAEIQPSSNRRR